MSEQQQPTELSKQRSQLSFFQSDAAFSHFFPFAGASRWNDHGNQDIMRCEGALHVGMANEVEPMSPAPGIKRSFWMEWWAQEPPPEECEVKLRKMKEKDPHSIEVGNICYYVWVLFPSWIGALAQNLNFGDKNSADVCVLEWNYTLFWRFQKLETWTHQTSEAMVMPCFMPGDLWPLMIHNDTCIWFEFQTKVYQGHNQEVNLMSVGETYPIRRCNVGARKCR